MAIASASQDAKLKKEICLCPLPNCDFRPSVRTVSNKPPDTDIDCDKHRVDQFSQEMARSANAKMLTGFLRCCPSAWRSHVTYLTFGSNCGPQLWRSCDICLAECGVYSSKHPAFCRSPAVTYFTLVADVTGYRSFAAYMERLALM